MIQKLLKFFNRNANGAKPITTHFIDGKKYRWLNKQRGKILVSANIPPKVGDFIEDNNIKYVITKISATEYYKYFIIVDRV